MLFRSYKEYREHQKNQNEDYLLCEGGTLFCLVFDLDLSVSCSIGGTWEELLSESFFDKITDGSVEIAGGPRTPMIFTRAHDPKFEDLLSKKGQRVVSSPCDPPIVI